MTYRLSPGTTLNLHQIQPFLLGCDGARELLDDREAPEAEALCLGAERLGPLGQRLREKGLVEETDDPVDPVLRERLLRLDRMYGWWEERLDETGRRALALTRSAHAARKRFLWNYGQCPTLPETSFRRAATAGEAPRDVLCLGDDDLVCVPLAALGHRVTVFDLDEYLLTLISRVAQAEGLSIEPVRLDLTEPIDPRWGERFDVLFCDPCSNRECIELFLSRAIGCLRTGGTAHVAAMYPAERLYREIAAEMALETTGFQHDFNHYYWASMRLADYVSDQYSHRKTERTLPVVPMDRPYETEADLFCDFQTPDEYPYVVDFYEVDLARLPEAPGLIAEAFSLNGSTQLETAGRWTLSANRSNGGYVNLTADLQRGYLKLTMMPLNLGEERLARQSIAEVFGGKVMTHRTSSGPEIELF